MCVCEQLPGTNSSPIVAKLSVIPLATGDRVIKFWKVKVKVGGGGMRSNECPSSQCISTYILMQAKT